MTAFDLVAAVSSVRSTPWPAVLSRTSACTLSASLAYVHDPEGTGGTEPVVRASVSAYARWSLPLDWRAHATLIWGGISNYDGASWLDSITGEVLFTLSTSERLFAQPTWANGTLYVVDLAGNLYALRP